MSRECWRSTQYLATFVSESETADCSSPQLLSRRNALHERAQSRRAALEDSFHLQQFFRDSDELKSWINEKMKTATDEAYKVAPQTLGDVLRF